MNQESGIRNQGKLKSIIHDSLFMIRSRGFTLIELIVAIGVIGVLTSVLVTLINPDTQLRKSRDTRRKSDLSLIQSALEQYRSDQDSYPLTIDFPACGNSFKSPPPAPFITYMEKIPCDPLPASLYTYSSDGITYSIVSCLENKNDSQKDSTNVAPCNGTTNFSYTVPASVSIPTPTPTPVPTATPVPPTPTPLPLKQVFVTSITYPANLGGLAGADAKCQSRAVAAGLGGTWRAWLSDQTVSAASRLTHNAGPYKLVDGTPIANSWTDLTDGVLANPINKTEFGGLPPATTTCPNMVYTQTFVDGSNLVFNNACFNWTSNSGDGVAGAYDSTTNWWTFSCVGSLCSGQGTLYCFEQ